MSLYNRLDALTVQARAELLSTVDTVSDRELEESYHAMLDDCHGPVTVCGFEFSSADALQALDPVAYRCGFADFTDPDSCGATEYSGVFYANQSLEDALDAFDEAEEAKADALAEAAEAEAQHPSDEGDAQ